MTYQGRDPDIMGKQRDRSISSTQRGSWLSGTVQDRVPGSGLVTKASTILLANQLEQHLYLVSLFLGETGYPAQGRVGTACRK